MDESKTRSHYTQIFIDIIVNLTVLSLKINLLALMLDGKPETAMTCPSIAAACMRPAHHATPTCKRPQGDTVTTFSGWFD
jgi:hypothetical protein